MPCRSLPHTLIRCFFRPCLFIGQLPATGICRFAIFEENAMQLIAGLISYCWYNPQPMRNDHSIAGTTILETTLEDADNTQFFIDGKTNPVVKVGRWTLRRFGVQHHRQSVAMKGKVGRYLLFLSWLLTDDGVEHRNVLKSIYQLLPPDLSYHQ